MDDPRIHISERDGRVRLGLDGLSYVEGATLQEAADRLVEKLLTIARAFHGGGGGAFSTEVAADAVLLDFIWQLGETAAAGGDVRERLFGPGVTLP